MRSKGFDIPAVVVGGGIYALATIRALRKEGITVYYVDNWKNGAMYSSYCKKSFIVPNINENKNLLKSTLLKLIPSPSRAVLFPASDSMALNISNLKDELKSYILTVPKKDILETLINKKRFYESLNTLNVPHPITTYVEDYEILKKISKRIVYPVYVKPSVSHQFWEIFQKKGFVAKSAEELMRYFKLTKNAKMQVMIQEIIPGPASNHIFIDGYIDAKKNPKVFFARQRLRMWPLGFGNSTVCKSISVKQVTSQKAILSKYLRSVNYAGIFSAEFKKDERDDVFKLLEINSRTSAWFSALSAKCGVNIMLIAYLNAIGKDTEYTENYEAGFSWLDLENDIKAVTDLILRKELNLPTLFFSVLQRNQEYFPFAIDDPYPFIVNLKRFLVCLKKV